MIATSRMKIISLVLICMVSGISVWMGDAEMPWNTW